MRSRDKKRIVKMFMDGMSVDAIMRSSVPACLRNPFESLRVSIEAVIREALRERRDP